MKTNRCYLLIGLLLVGMFPAVTHAEDAPTATAKGWFAGVQGGLPLGVSTFSSFGADKTRVGFSAGLYGGYRFNPVLSLEATAKWGNTLFASQSCCASRHYWLGEDGIRYHAPVLNMNGWSYDNLKSTSFMQHYGLQLNVNLLGFFDPTKHGRWTLELSPLVAAVGSKATLKTISDDAEVKQEATRWHVGVGGNVQASCQVARHVNIAIYSGLTYYTGDRIDGAPVNLHQANYTWESGLKVGFTFGKRVKKANSVAPAQQPQPVVEEVQPEPQPEVTVCPEPTLPDTILAPEPQPEPLQVALYFAFNSTAIADSEKGKLQELKQYMEANPDMKIVITGWCDSRGSDAVNNRVSQRRAEAVKSHLVESGIDATRICVRGMGVDTGAVDDALARRADCVTVKTVEE